MCRSEVSLQPNKVNRAVDVLLKIRYLPFQWHNLYEWDSSLNCTVNNILIQILFTRRPQTPAPGTYRVVDPKVYLKGTPVYTQKGRAFPPGDRTIKPGPGAHSPEKVRL